MLFAMITGNTAILKPDFCFCVFILVVRVYDMVVAASAPEDMRCGERGWYAAVAC